PGTLAHRPRTWAALRAVEPDTGSPPGGAARSLCKLVRPKGRRGGSGGAVSSGHARAAVRGGGSGGEPAVAICVVDLCRRGIMDTAARVDRRHGGPITG